MKEKFPNPRLQLKNINDYIKKSVPFTFIRFSDGEIEILKNRYLEIGEGITHFRGQILNNNYPVYDRKIFDPLLHSDFRNLLIRSAQIRNTHYFIGIPTKHNNAIDDREFMLEINGGFSESITFADLLINSNYKYFRSNVLPNILKRKNIVVIANHRAKLNNSLQNALHIKVNDNFFNDYNIEIENIINQLINIPTDSIILSSASSLTNIIAYDLFQIRKDLTFIDIGTSLNDLLNLESRSRMYHQVLFSTTFKQKILGIIYRFNKEYKIKW